MNIETERKFLVRGDGFLSEAVSSRHICQGYLARHSGVSRSVRVRTCDDKGVLTVKGPSSDGISRLEWEEEIPYESAVDLMGLCLGSLIDKTRYIVPVPGSERCFEVDVFHGDNEGLVVAEIELGDPDEPFSRPSWLGEEVTGDKRYYNSRLSLEPYRDW